MADQVARRRARPRAADRRAARRARAGHHDRRRVPALLDAAAALHHRRHAGPRAVHAQHGHRRLDRRRRRRARRRARGAAHPEPPPRGDRRACCGSRGSCWRSTRWTSSATTQDVFRRICADFRAWAVRLDVEEIACIPISALVGDNVVERSERDGLVPRPDAARSSSRRRRSAAGLADGPLRLPVQYVIRAGEQRALRRPARGRHRAGGRRGRGAARQA